MNISKKEMEEAFEKFLKDNGYETGYYVETSLVFKAFKAGFESGQKPEGEMICQRRQMH